jgi:ComF family protein
LSNSGQIIFDISTKIEHSLSTLLGQDCLLCGAESHAGLLCAGCTAELPHAHAVVLCPQCAAPSPAGAICGRCLSHRPHYDRSVTAWRYAYPVDRLMQSFKYGAQLAVAKLCAKHIAIAGDLHNDPFRPSPVHAGLRRVDLVLAMPLHPRRLRERGFNQAVEIARPLARALGLPFDPLALQRVRDTAAQAGLAHTARIRNVRGAFASVRDVRGLHVAVVDDVMTTGATLDEVAKTLKKAGATRVVNWVAARTPDHGRQE